MASKIEEIIEDLEIYIDECKPSAFSSSKISVNRDEIDAIIHELKTNIPSEIARYRKVINNEKAIIDDANKRAAAIISEAKIETDKLVSEHKIMREAYDQANRVVMAAAADAQNNLDEAYKNANEIRQSAIKYTDELLASVQEIIFNSIATTRRNQDNYLRTMQEYLDTVVENRKQLAPTPTVEQIMNSEPDFSNTGDISANLEAEAASIMAQQTSNLPSPAEKPINKQEPKLEMTNTVIDIPEQFFKKD